MSAAELFLTMNCPVVFQAAEFGYGVTERLLIEHVFGAGVGVGVGVGLGVGVGHGVGAGVGVGVDLLQSSEYS